MKIESKFVEKRFSDADLCAESATFIKIQMLYINFCEIVFHQKFDFVLGCLCVF